MICQNVGKPPSEPSVQIEGKGVGTIRVVEPSYGDSLLLTSYSGMKLEASGQLIFKVAPGRYVINVTHPSHKSRGFSITIPPPGEEGQTTHEVPVVLERNEKLLNWEFAQSALS